MTKTILRFNGKIYIGVSFTATNGIDEFPLIVFTTEAETAMRGEDSTEQSRAITNSIMGFIPFTNSEIVSRLKSNPTSIEAAISAVLPSGIIVKRDR